MHEQALVCQPEMNRLGGPHSKGGNRMVVAKNVLFKLQTKSYLTKKAKSLTFARPIVLEKEIVWLYLIPFNILYY
jgi:hypothetical protein